MPKTNPNASMRIIVAFIIVFVVSAIAVVALFMSRPSSSQPVPSATPSVCENCSPSGISYEVHEWGVIAGCPISNEWFLTSRPEQLFIVKQPVIYVHVGNGNLDVFSAKVTLSDGAITLTYPQAKISGRSAEWADVKVLKEEIKAIPAGASKDYLPLESIIPTLNNVDADMLSYGGKQARFLFYEGEINFENKVEATYDAAAKKATLKNNADYAVYDVSLSVKPDSDFIAGKYYIASASELKPHQQLTVALKENPDYIDLKSKMAAIGFTERESDAFNSLWQMPFSYPTNLSFERLSYRIPQSEVDKLAKLELNPAPKKVLRTLWVLVDLKSPEESAKQGIVKSCSSDTDCEWTITNCCPESAGAHWECINPKLSKIECLPKGNICLQVLSPRPERECLCKNGTCNG